MKTIRLTRASLAAAFGLAVLMPAAPLTAQNAQDLKTLFELGRAAYHKGDLETARQLLSQVAAARPDHSETRNMLASIQTYAKAVSPLKTTYGALIIPKVDFTEVTLTEALEGLGVMAKNASGGKVTPNFIVKSPELGKKLLTLNLTTLPLTEVIEYLARLVGGKAVYEKHAVVFTPLTE